MTRRPPSWGPVVVTVAVGVVAWWLAAVVFDEVGGFLIGAWWYATTRVVVAWTNRGRVAVWCAPGMPPGHDVEVRLEGHPVVVRKIGRNLANQGWSKR